MSNNFYDILGISKNASQEEIKKAYRKNAMQYHPDRNKGNKDSEKKFKEINQAYDVLGDATKRKQYDAFGSTGNNFGSSARGHSGFEDMFGKGFQGSSGGFNIEDLFRGFSSGETKKSSSQHQEPETLDFEKTYEVPIFDLILGCKIEVKGVYGTKATLKIPPSTKPGKKFRVKGYGKKEGLRSGNLIVKIEALMPKDISEVDMQMLQSIRDNIGYS